MHCNFSSCYTLKHIYTCIVCTLSNIRKCMSAWPLLDTDCSFINPWLAVIFIGVRPHNSPNHLRFLPGGLCSWLQEPDFFLATATATVADRRWNWAASSFFGNWCRKPKVEWPYQDRSEKKGVRSIQWWMDGAVGSLVFFPTFPATNGVIDPHDSISIKGWLISILSAERVLLLDAQVAVFSAHKTSWVAIAPTGPRRAPGGRAMCDAPIFVNENGILLFKYRMVPRKGRLNLVWSLEVSGKDQQWSAYRPKNEQIQDLNRVSACESTQFHLMQKQATPWHVLCGVNKRYPQNQMVSHFLKKNPGVFSREHGIWDGFDFWYISRHHESTSLWKATWYT